MQGYKLKGLLASTAIGMTLGLIPHLSQAMSQEQSFTLAETLSVLNALYINPQKGSDWKTNLKVFLGDKKFTDDFTEEEFTKSANRMLRNLDPHSSYMDKKTTAEAKSSLQGNFVGIGIVVNFEKDNLEIAKTLAESPAQASGLKVGDVILRIIDTERKIDIAVTPDNLGESMGAIRGTEGKPVTLHIRRAGQEKLLTMTVTRAKVETSPVTYQFDNDVGYITLSEFNQKAAGDVKAAVEAIEHAGGAKKGYILDLRNDPGGLLVAANDILKDLAIQPGITITERKRDPSAGVQETQYRIDTPKNILKGKELIVLINEGSASASEIVSGSLKDMKRATIYGNQSYGKGSGQVRVPINRGFNVAAVTNFLYFLPSGISIQGHGVTPDVVNLMSPRQTEEAQDRFDKILAKVKEKDPTITAKDIFSSEATKDNVITNTGAAVDDHNMPSQTCAAKVEDITPDVPKEFRSATGNKLDTIKACAWETLKGHRTHTVVQAYKGEPLRFVPRQLQ